MTIKLRLVEIRENNGAKTFTYEPVEEPRAMEVNHYMDTEFIENGVTIDLLSIGIVSEDGREFYALNWDCDLSKADDWVRHNVLVHLPPKPKSLYPIDHGSPWMSKKTIEVKLAEYFKLKLVPPRGNLKGDWTYEVNPKNIPDFWADYAAYDWIAFCQIWGKGKMIDLPRGFPMYCNDIQQLKADREARQSGFIGWIGWFLIVVLIPPFLRHQEPPARTGTEHHALDDARHVKKLWEYYTGRAGFLSWLYYRFNL